MTWIWVYFFNYVGNFLNYCEENDVFGAFLLTDFIYMPIICAANRLDRCDMYIIFIFSHDSSVTGEARL